MAKIKLAKALKEKNKIVKKINLLQSRIQQNNSIIAGNTRAYDVTETMKALTTEIANLVKIKSAISAANSVIQPKIYEIGELKSYIQFLRGVNTNDGKIIDRYNSNEPLTYDATIKEKEKQELIESTEAKIEKMQEEIDNYNYTTEIEY